MPEPNSGCWLWLGGVNESGYGIIGLGRREQGVAKAHRVSFELHKRPLGKGECVLHTCDNPACVNPDHLRAGTLVDNARDMVAKGRDFRPDNRGERAAWRKLSALQVAEIKKRERPGAVYANEFGVSRSAIYEIWRGRNWASV